MNYHCCRHCYRCHICHHCRHQEKRRRRSRRGRRRRRRRRWWWWWRRRWRERRQEVNERKPSQVKPNQVKLKQNQTRQTKTKDACTKWGASRAHTCLAVAQEAWRNASSVVFWKKYIFLHNSNSSSNRKRTSAREIPSTSASSQVTRGHSARKRGGGSDGSASMFAPSGKGLRKCFPTSRPHFWAAFFA